jgi:hypothetical protein
MTTTRVHHPSFTGRKRRGQQAIAVLAAAIAVALTAQAGLWFVPFVLGLAAGVAGSKTGWRKSRTLLAVVVAAAAGWGAPLWWSALSGQPVGATARVIAALAGLPPHAVTGVAATLLVAVIQAAVGLWLGWLLIPRQPAN